ncbi:hypothetical protein RISK_002309 [Rhodopirellula islandica]|uniref:Uncharacterized protein n=1 Tax=Rhodopirellula islandica TaxID=595434 RepID=A0A0J1BGK1_RHOIS|nr:hypothetical protein RISK_002309 [Rhodopirellula islandica]
MKKDRSHKDNCIRNQNANSKHLAVQASAKTAHMVNRG